MARFIPRLFCCLACALAAGLPPALAQQPQPMQAAALAPGEHIALDGTLDAPAWQRAPVFSDFIEREPRNGAPPRYPTRVRVLTGAHALYVGVEALDPQPALIRAPLVRHDGVVRTQDFVALYLDPIGRGKVAQWFRVNAAGSTADGVHTGDDDNEDFSPDFDFDAAAARTPQGYTAVFRIPYATLRAASGERAPWRIMVVRRIPRDNNVLEASVPLPPELPSFIANMQPLRGAPAEANAPFLQLRPTLTLRRTLDQPPGAPGTASTAASAGLDVKWRPRADWVIDATLKPDFSQVALDVPQLSRNTRFALSLTEKRPFFLESSDLLRSPTDALYTRSITLPDWGVRGVTAVNFNRDADTLSFSSVTDVLPLPAHVQDTASTIMQLAGMLATQPALFSDGASVPMQVARPRGLDRWEFEVVGYEQLQTGQGPLWAWHVRRVPRKTRGDIGVDLWLSPQLQSLPVRIRLTQAEDVYLDLLLDKAEQG